MRDENIKEEQAIDMLENEERNNIGDGRGWAGMGGGFELSSIRVTHGGVG